MCSYEILIAGASQVQQTFPKASQRKKFDNYWSRAGVLNLLKHEGLRPACTTSPMQQLIHMHREEVKTTKNNF